MLEKCLTPQSITYVYDIYIGYRMHMSYPISGCTMIALGFVTFDEIKIFW